MASATMAFRTLLTQRPSGIQLLTRTSRQGIVTPFFTSLEASESRRTISSTRAVLHENPLGIPRKPPAPGAGPKGPAPTMPRMQRGLPQKMPIKGVKHIIAVASGKGGVGKSTTSVNLALAIAGMNKRVGILDADIFGPSIPRLMNLSGEPELTGTEDRLVPLTNFGVKCMSMGFLVDEEAPVVWRGLMVMKALQQLLHQVEWGELDLLVIDMPPGTGDTQLTISQQIPLSGVVIVSTPQDIALIDARKGVNMFKKVNVPILGMVQNMSLHVCSNCNHESHIFGDGGAERTAKEMNLDFLGDVALHSDICQLSDKGQPVVVSRPDSKHTQYYKAIASKVVAKLWPPEAATPSS
ncbi:hypothetical protein EC957_004038 [Mortierella hygrophila]|uniref:Nucleotide-binding protein-like n=1 Tax=Mortierella hygrophila TaxID=979708 RepID=A0A9P6F2N8_9FUNG|nr:hypothetical protein EC957_004038 [Mortierella hygrophila]